MVPTHFQAIFALPPDTLAQRKGTARALRTIISNAAALPQPVKERIVAHFGEGLLHETYGSTEAGIVTNIRPQDQLRTRQSVGRAFALNEIRLLGPDGSEVPVGEVGELYSRSPYLFEGYWNHPEWTAECSREGGWVSAGDLARRDAEGFLYIVDRKKDMIISGGFNVYAADIEVLVGRHEAVLDVTVIGTPHPKWGETPLALVIPRPGAVADAQQILAWSNERLGKHQRLGGVEFRQEFPRNALGKVLKRVLRGSYWAAVTSSTG